MIELMGLAAKEVDEVTRSNLRFLYGK